MAKTLLVSVDVPLGREVLAALDAAGLGIKVALWAGLSAYEDWRLLLASPRLDKAGILGGYRAVNDAMDAAGISVYRAPIKMVLSMTDPSIKELRRRYAKAGDVEGMRVSGRFGSLYVEDSYVYRIT